MRDSSSPTGFGLWEAVDGLRDAFAPRVSARMGRGDIRTAILLALVEKPMHGYQVIQAIEARSRGAWKPSPGSIYPTLQLLSDEGLVTSDQVGERKVYSLTDTGREVADESATEPHPSDSRRPWNDERAALPKAGMKLASAIAQVARGGTAEQAESAVAVIDEARRKLYAILAEG